MNEKIWGKTLTDNFGQEVYYPLMGHMLDTAVVAGVLWDEWLRTELKSKLISELGETAKQYIQFAAGLHDLGKASPIFQGSLLNPRGNRSDVIEFLEADGFSFPEIDDIEVYRKKKFHRHEKLGSYALDPTKEGLRSRASEKWLNLVIVGHHGSFAIDYGTLRDNQVSELDSLLDARWNNEQNSIIASFERFLNVTISDISLSEATASSIILISGLIILADRIASSIKSVENSYKLLQAHEISIQDPSDWQEKRKAFLRKLAKEEVGFAEQIDGEDILGAYSARGVQKVVPDKAGLWICMAPTGAGKTEAALLRHSHRNERLIFLLPTLSTTNAMMGRLERIYSNKNATTAVLAHGLAYLENFYNSVRSSSTEDHEDCGLVPTEFSNVRGAKLSASINVATIDQMLMGSFRIKWTHLRWLLLANSHIVIDEAHLLDHYQVELIKPLLVFLGETKTRVSILSATLPNWLEKSFTSSYSHDLAEVSTVTSFPSSILIDSENFEKTIAKEIETVQYDAKINVTMTNDSVTTHVDWAEKMIRENPKARLGIFVNQVKRAQDIALELQQRIPAVTVICLHSRMFAMHRKQITDRLLKLLNTSSGSGERIILVGTQVIEMSLDIDLDLISTDICPAPSLIQRMGRVWRDKESTKRFERISEEIYPIFEASIVVPESKDTIDKFAVMPYSYSLISRTADYLKNVSTLSFPKDLQDFVETVYLSSTMVATEDDEREVADYFYKKMKGSDASIDERFLYNESLSFKEFSSKITDSEFSEDSATRLIEWDSIPFIIKSCDPSLIKLGAVKADSTLENLNFRAAQSGSVSITQSMDRKLSDIGDLTKISLNKFSFGYFGELPKGFRYDKLVGLMQE